MVSESVLTTNSCNFPTCLVQIQGYSVSQQFDNEVNPDELFRQIKTDYLVLQIQMIFCKLTLYIIVRDKFGTKELLYSIYTLVGLVKDTMILRIR